MPTSYTQNQLDAIEEAISSGAMTVSYTDGQGSSKSVTYRSLNDMIKIRDIIRRALGQVPTRTARIYPTLGKGLSGE